MSETPKRSSGRQRRKRTIRAVPAYITRKIPPFEFMDEDGLAKLEDQADWLIQEIGIEFRDDPIALDIWRKAGAEQIDDRGAFDNQLAVNLDHRGFAQRVHFKKVRRCEIGFSVALISLEFVGHADLFQQPEDAL